MYLKKIIHKKLNELKYLFTVLVVCALFLSFKTFISAQETKTIVSFTFDDGNTEDYLNYDLEKWNKDILICLKNNNLKVVLFASCKRLQNKKGEYVLKSWDSAGHNIANHTYSHKYFNSTKVSLDDFKADFLINDSVIRKYDNYIRLFRFPYLKEGGSLDKVVGFRNFLKERNYKNGYVTVDASDWYINDRLIKRLNENPNADISGFRTYYINHLYDRIMYYDSLAYNLTGRKIKHTILLHHNLAASLFLKDLIQFLKQKNINVIDALEAYQDKIYTKLPLPEFAGESLIWSLAKQSGKFESILRYPPEDGEYEKEKMDKLGL